MPAEVRQIAGYRLPERYYRDMLQLTASGPSQAYVYWEISDRKRWLSAQHFQRDWSELRHALRLYDVTLIRFDGANENSRRDVPINWHEADRHLHELQPGTVYAADYGIITDNNQFVPLLRSNAVTTPPEPYAGRQTEGSPYER